VAKSFRVDLVSVEAMVWSGEAEMLVARTVDGEMAVLAGHAPLLGQLKELAYDMPGGGFLSVTNEGVTVLAESTVPAEGDDPATLPAASDAPATADH
jgi:F-type H+-transporting ATPase subunit epsilon